MEYKYGKFTNNQILSEKNSLRRQIFFLLLIVDPQTKDKEEYKNIDVCAAFENVQREINGFNSLLNFPNEIVKIASLLEAAYIELNKNDFSWSIYRKLILDAGAKVMDIKEV